MVLVFHMKITEKKNDIKCGAILLFINTNKLGDIPLTGKKFCVDRYPRGAGTICRLDVSLFLRNGNWEEHYLGVQSSFDGFGSKRNKLRT